MKKNSLKQKIQKMVKEKNCDSSSCENKCCNSCNVNNAGCAGLIYVLGFIGALIYYISVATSFWVGVLGFLKALVWPAFLVFELMKYLVM